MRLLITLLVFEFIFAYQAFPAKKAVKRRPALWKLYSNPSCADKVFAWKQAKRGTPKGNCTSFETPKSLQYATQAVDQLQINDPIGEYESSPFVDTMISSIREHQFADAQGYCLTHVKSALVYSCWFQDRTNTVAASKFGSDLKNQGWTNLMDDPKYKDKFKVPADAPKGAILVYDGGPYGHIEVKLDKGADSDYGSDYVSNLPRTLDPYSDFLSIRSKGKSQNSFRRLIGIYVKFGGPNDYT